MSAWTSSSVREYRWRMIEILFADYPRLQTYAEQVGRRPRLIPNFSGTLGLTGPSISVTFSQQDPSKAYEQLNVVRRYLHKKGLVRATYNQPAAELQFCEETIDLRHVLIPPKVNHPLLKNGLSVWISDYLEIDAERHDLLFLIEHFPLPDILSAGYVSGWTLLAMLRQEFSWYPIPAEHENVMPGDAYPLQCRARPHSASLD
jgi:hypothetical protein